MSSEPPQYAPEVTTLLARWSAGEREALDELVPAVYEELRRLARIQLANERPGHTLEPTAVVHEAYLRLGSYDRIRWQDRVHFYSVASRIMRRVLVDHARKRRAAKRGGRETRVTLTEAIDAPGPTTVEVDIIDLDDAMSQLAEKDPRACRVVEMHYFGGLDYEAIAEALEISVPTVRRDWAVAKLWLRRALTA